MDIFPGVGELGHFNFKCRSTFSFLKNHHTVFHNSYASVEYYHQCVMVVTSSSVFANFFFFWMMAILTSMSWYLTAVFIYISEASNFEYFSCVCGAFGFFLWKIPVHNCCPYHIWIVHFVGIELHKLLIYPQYWYFTRCIVWKYFPSFCSYPGFSFFFAA